MPRERKSFFRRLIEFRFLFVINVAVLALLGVSFGREFLRNFEIQKDIADLQDQANALEARHLQITELNSTLQTESAIEREARLKLGLKKPGEQVVVIRDAPSGVATNDPTNPDLIAIREEETALRSLANPVKWWYYFFDQETFERLTKNYGS